LSLHIAAYLSHDQGCSGVGWERIGTNSPYTFCVGKRSHTFLH